MHLVDYRWKCIFRETPTEAIRNANSCWLVFPHWFLLLTVVDLGLLTHLDWSLLLPFSTASLHLSSSTALSGFLYKLPLSGFLCQLLSSPTSGVIRDLESKPFVWFRAKTDKGIVCLACSRGPKYVVSERKEFAEKKPSKLEFYGRKFYFIDSTHRKLKSPSKYSPSAAMYLF